MTIKDRQFENYAIQKEFLGLQTSQVFSHNFYELVYINKGIGVHHNHGLDIDFARGDLFLVRPGEQHHFIVEQNIEVYVVRFSEQTRRQLKQLVGQSNGKAVSLSKAKSPIHLKVSFAPDEQQLIVHLLEFLILLDQDPLRNENLWYYQLLCLVTIIERNLSYGSPEERISTAGIIPEVLKYIHKNLHDTEILRLDRLAERFSLSTNQLGILFRREVRESVKKYVNKCRMELIAQSVRDKRKTFSQIAFEFGFVDESHLYKGFKKFYGMSPTAFRAG